MENKEKIINKEKLSTNIYKDLGGVLDDILNSSKEELILDALTKLEETKPALDKLVKQGDRCNIDLSYFLGGQYFTSDMVLVLGTALYVLDKDKFENFENAIYMHLSHNRKD